MPIAPCPYVCGCSAMAGVGYEPKMAGATRESVKLKGVVNNESTGFGIYQKILDRVLATNGI